MQVATSGLASLARMPFNLGVNAGEAGRARQAEPDEPLQLYEFEACPFCRYLGLLGQSEARKHDFCCLITHPGLATVVPLVPIKCDFQVALPSTLADSMCSPR